MYDCNGYCIPVRDRERERERRGVKKRGEERRGIPPPFK
jgi:hypothetical protein